VTQSNQIAIFKIGNRFHITTVHASSVLKSNSNTVDSSQSCESGAQSAVSIKACNKSELLTVFLCMITRILPKPYSCRNKTSFKCCDSYFINTFCFNCCLTKTILLKKVAITLLHSVHRMARPISYAVCSVWQSEHCFIFCFHF